MAPRKAFPKAKAEAEKALELYSDLGQPHAPLAYTALHFDWDWSHSEREFRRAIELSPSYAHAHHWCSHLLTALRRKEESLAESRLALSLEPLDVVLTAHLAWHHQMFREYDRARLPYLNAEPRLDDCRSDPRLQELIRRVGPPR